MQPAEYNPQSRTARTLHCHYYRSLAKFVRVIAISECIERPSGHTMDSSRVGVCSAAASAISRTLLFILVLHVFVAASAPSEDLISSLPGQPAVTFKQYGGFITVDAQRGRALYYYFVEAESDADTKPLTLWLNGGPGCSSVGAGAFTELGPFYTLGDSLTKNDRAWNRVSNVLFLESPAGVGFSYSNTTSDYTTGDIETAHDSLIFLLEWFKKFPEFRKRDFYITGESYAGHYAPQLAAAVVENNNLPGQPRIQLKGVMVGNPLFHLEIDTVYSPVMFLWSHGLVSETTYHAIISQCKFNGTRESLECLGKLNDSGSEAAIFSAIDAYDVLADICLSSASTAETRRLKQQVKHNFRTNLDVALSPCIEDQANTYLNLPEVQRALHANVINWSICSGVVNYSGADISIPMLPVLKVLLSRGLRVWIFSGDEDSVIPFIGTRQLVDELASDSNLKSTSPYGIWYQGQQVGGWTSSWGDLTYATVRGAGHMVATTQPSRALQLFTSFIAGAHLPQSFASSSVP